MLNRSIQKMTYAGFVFALLALPASAQVKEPPSLDACQRYVKNTLSLDCFDMCNTTITRGHTECSKACEKMINDFNGACIFWSTPGEEKPTH
jgi:hypothetical protein